MKKQSKQPSLRFLISALFISLAVIPVTIFVVVSWYQYDLLVLQTNSGVSGSLLTRVKLNDLFFFLLYLLLVIPSLLYFVRKLTSPLRQLEKKAKLMSSGGLDGAVEVVKDKSWLFKELSQFIDTFEVLRKQVVGSYQELESQVAERTWDLHHKIHQLTNAEEHINKVNSELAEALAVNERQRVVLQDVIDNMPVGVLITKKPNGSPEFINRKAEKLFGRDLSGQGDYSQRYGLFMTDKRTPYPGERLPINQSFRSKKSLYAEDILIKSGDDFVQIYCQSAVIYDKVGQVELSIMVFDDITARKEIERQKSEFVSVVSHQLRTPLSAVRWLVELLMDKETGALNKLQKEYLDSINQSNKRLIDLVNDLLNVSRIESGKVTIEPVATDIKALIESVVKDLKPLIEGHRQKIRIVEAKILPLIKIDPRLISQVIINLLSNASKYSPDKTIIEVILNKNDSQAEISVKDEGLGIPKSNQHKVFTKFFRADNVIKKETEGTGLGLYVVKQVIQNSGGRIWFSSVENKGTTFTFTLPLAGTPEAEKERKLI